MKTILFDLDGTLIDSTDAIVESFGVAFHAFDTPVPPKSDITQLIGYPLDTMFVKLGISSEKALEYVQAYKEHYRVISRAQTTLLPLAKEAIVRASEVARLGVVTTKTAHYSKELLEHFGVMRYFDVLIGRESVSHPKPHPEPILRAVEELGALADKTWMIGDTILDLIAAREANVHGVGVLCGYGKRDDLERYTKALFLDAKEAVEMIAKA